MSIVSTLIRKKITFGTAVAQFGTWLGQVVGQNVVLSQAGTDMLSTLKQAASDAIAMGDTALVDHADELATAVAAAVNAALTAATGGKSAPASPIVSAGIKQLVNIAVTAAHAEALAFEAALTPAQPVAANT